MLASKLVQDLEVVQTARWVVLRCASKDTLALADSLNRVNIVAYTPVDQQTKKRRKQEDECQPVTIMPGYVFVQACFLGELLRLLKQPTLEHKSFALMQTSNGFPVVPDKELNGLRQEEQRLAKVRHRNRLRTAEKIAYKIGSLVKMSEGSFAGIEGKVLGNRGKYAVITFDSVPWPVEVNSVLLSKFVVDPQTINA